MASQPLGLLILDANVLIDYCAADSTILTLISRDVGQINTPCHGAQMKQVPRVAQPGGLARDCLGGANGPCP
jgi:hypothetical protein